MIFLEAIQFYREVYKVIYVKIFFNDMSIRIIVVLVQNSSPGTDEEQVTLTMHTLSYTIKIQMSLKFDILTHVMVHVHL